MIHLLLRMRLKRSWIPSPFISIDNSTSHLTTSSRSAGLHLLLRKLWIPQRWFVIINEMKSVTNRWLSIPYVPGFHLLQRIFQKFSFRTRKLNFKFVFQSKNISEQLDPVNSIKLKWLNKLNVNDTKNDTKLLSKLVMKIKTLKLIDQSLGR